MIRQSLLLSIQDRLSRPVLAFLCLAAIATLAIAQQRLTQPASFYQDAGEGYQKIEMPVGTSRVLTFEYDIPKVVISDGIVTAKPVSPNQIMLQAVQPGIASLYVHDANGEVQPIDIIVLADTRPLSEALSTLFPEAQLKVRPLNSTVALTGFAASTEQVSQIMEVSRTISQQPLTNSKLTVTSRSC